MKPKPRKGRSRLEPELPSRRRLCELGHPSAGDAIADKKSGRGHAVNKEMHIESQPQPGADKRSKSTPLGPIQQMDHHRGEVARHTNSDQSRCRMRGRGARGRPPKA